MKRTRLILMAALMGFALTGCDAETKDRTSSYVMPKDLAEKGCKVYKMEADGSGKTLYALYCPNAQTTTTYRANKQNHHTTVVDEGVDYGYN